MTGIRALLAVVMLLGPTGCSGDSDPTFTAEDFEAATGKAQVAYEVDGVAPTWLPKGRQRMNASITMTTPTGTEQGDVSLPLRNKAGGDGLRYEFGRGEFVYIAAQNQGEYGSVTCRIVVDGEVVSENTSTAAYGIATCKATT